VTEKKINLTQLPKGWVWTTIDSILSTLESGGRPKGGVREVKEGVPSIGGEHLLYSGRFDFSRIRYIPMGFYQGMTRGKVLRDDILVVKDGATTGKTAFVSDNFPFSEAAVNEHVFILRVPKKYVEPRYLFFWMQSPFGQRCVKDNFQGTAQGGINSYFVQNSNFPLAPFPGQRHIVLKIEELFAYLDAGVERLRKVEAQLKRYRQAVLKYAFEGKLTEEWRKTHKDLIEPAPALLQCILQDRRAKWEGQHFARMKGKGIAPKDDSWKKKYKEPTSPDITNLPELPEGWTWTTVDQLAWSVKDGPHYSPEYVDNGIPFITGGNVRPSGVDFDSAKKISRELYRRFSERCKPETGDILYTKGGTTGIARVNTYSLEFSVWVHVAVLKLAGPIEPFYVQHALNSPFCYEQAQRFTHGVGNQDLGLTRMIRIVVSLPPLVEQKEINERIDRLQSIADKVERIVEINFRYAEQLRQIILRDAFLGRLVSQDPGDEPAEKLLQRIREEKAKSEDEKGKNRKKGIKPKQLELSTYVE
jgi:type I restriction enzyme S subunit